MDIRDHRNRLISADNLWESERTKIALAAGQDALALCIRRVQGTGESSVGGLFGTLKPSTQRSKKRKGQTRAPFPAINFTDENRMLRTTRPRLGRVTATTIEVVIEPTDKQRREVMAYHNKRFQDKKGKVIAFNEKERNIVREDHLEGVLDFINKNEL